VPRRMVGVSASVNLPLHHEVQKFSSGTGSPGWSRKKGHKTVVVSGFIGACQIVQYTDNLLMLVLYVTATTTTTILWPFVRDYPGEPVPEETLTHPPS